LKNKVNTLLNASNQASLIHTEHVSVHQANIIAIFGDNFSNTLEDWPETIKLTLKINQSGEIKISSTGGGDISKNVKILSDKKVSSSEEGGD